MNAINYRVKKISGGGDWLAHQNAALKISVGSEYHEGSKLQAALEWAAARFSHLHICVADTLQRHNLYSSLAADEAAKVSLRLGDNWIERNQHFFRAVGVPYSIWRWDHWLNDQRYAPARALIEAQHHCDQALSDTLDMDVLGYLNRHGLTPGAPGYESRKQNGMDYLKEELAVFTYWQDTLQAAEIYPGRNLMIEERIMDGTITSLPASLSCRSLVKIGFLRQEQFALAA